MSAPPPNIHHEGTEPPSFTPALGRHPSDGDLVLVMCSPGELSDLEQMDHRNPVTTFNLPGGEAEHARRRL
jgi:hypothetical protein